MISHTPWWQCFLMDQISFSYFCRRSPGDHFCQIIFSSDHWFQEIKPRPPWRPCFLTYQISFSNFCRSPKEHSLAQWYRCCCHLKEIVDDTQQLTLIPIAHFEHLRAKNTELVAAKRHSTQMIPGIYFPPYFPLGINVV